MNEVLIQHMRLYVLPGGFGNISSASMSLAVQRVLEELYRGMIASDRPVSDILPEKDQRNQEILARYITGERAIDLAREFGISVRRVNRLIRRYLDRGQE
jgi:Helix-turn-helix domain